MGPLPLLARGAAVMLREFARGYADDAELDLPGARAPQGRRPAEQLPRHGCVSAGSRWSSARGWPSLAKHVDGAPANARSTPRPEPGTGARLVPMDQPVTRKGG